MYSRTTCVLSIFQLISFNLFLMLYERVTNYIQSNTPCTQDHKSKLNPLQSIIIIFNTLVYDCVIKQFLYSQINSHYQFPLQSLYIYLTLHDFLSFSKNPSFLATSLFHYRLKKQTKVFRIYDKKNSSTHSPLTTPVKSTMGHNSLKTQDSAKIFIVLWFM